MTSLLPGNALLVKLLSLEMQQKIKHLCNAMHCEIIVRLFSKDFSDILNFDILHNVYLYSMVLELDFDADLFVL